MDMRPFKALAMIYEAGFMTGFWDNTDEDCSWLSMAPPCYSQMGYFRIPGVTKKFTKN